MSRKLSVVSKDQSLQSEEKDVYFALERCLLPMIELFAKFRVTYPGFDAMAKEMFVTVAENELQEQGDTDPPVSHLAFYSGLKPAEIRRVQNARDKHPDESVAHAFSPEGRVLEIWTHDSMFQNTDGSFKDLPVLGPGATFQGLVRKALKDASYDQMMQSLHRAQCIELFMPSPKVKMVRLVKPKFKPSTDDMVGRLKEITHTYRRLMSTCLNNISLDGVPGERGDNDEELFQWGLWTRRLTEKDKLRFRREVKLLLRKMEKEAAVDLKSLEDELPKDDGSLEAGISMFYFEGPLDK